MLHQQVVERRLELMNNDNERRHVEASFTPDHQSQIQALDILAYVDYLNHIGANGELTKFLASIFANKSAFAKLDDEHLNYLSDIKPVERYIRDQPDLVYVFLSARKKCNDSEGLFAMLVADDSFSLVAIDHPELLDNFSAEELTQLMAYRKSLRHSQKLLDLILARDFSEAILTLLDILRGNKQAIEKVIPQAVKRYRDKIKIAFYPVILADDAIFAMFASDSQLFREMHSVVSASNILRSRINVEDAVKLIAKFARDEDWRKRNITQEAMSDLRYRNSNRYVDLLFASEILMRAEDIFRIYYVLFEYDQYMHPFIRTGLPNIIVERFTKELDAYSIASLLIRHPEFGMAVLQSKNHPFIEKLDGLNLKRMADANEQFARLIAESGLLSGYKEKRERKASVADKFIHNLFSGRRAFEQTLLIDKTKMLSSGGACSGFVMDAVRSHLDHEKEKNYTYADKANRAMFQSLDTLLGRSYIHRVEYYQNKWNDPRKEREKESLAASKDVEEFSRMAIKLILNGGKDYVIISSETHLMALIPKKENGKIVKLLFLDPNGGEINLNPSKSLESMTKKLARELREYKKDGKYDFTAYHVKKEFFAKPHHLRRSPKAPVNDRVMPKLTGHG